ncbi:dienelactone hydrolase [Obelidium mucronatum]|nr:dienelactone hydrolase [Obelidium mucronatum]
MSAHVVHPAESARERHPLRGSVAPNTLRPAVVVLQEWWGVNAAVLAHAQRLANNTGAIAVVPDLYNGTTTADKEEAAHLMANLDWPLALNNLQRLVERLQRPADDGAELLKDRKVASLGFCMGGALSLAIAARMAEIKKPLNACVSFYGTPSPSLIDISNIPATTPVQAHFGELDEYKGFSDIKTAHKLAESWDLTVQKLGGTHAHGFHSLESNVYVHHGLGHAFMNEDGSARHVFGGEVDKTWEKVFKFLVEHLKTV